MRLHQWRSLSLCMAGVLLGAAGALAQTANNTCGDNQAANTIPGVGGTVTDNFFGSSPDFSASSGCGVDDQDVYFYFTPAVTASYRFSTCSSVNNIDTTLSIHTGCPARPENYAGAFGTACNDNACGNRSQFDSGTLMAGTLVVIRVGHDDQVFVGDGFTLTVSIAPQGACCDGSSAVCTLVATGTCTHIGGYRGDGTVCTPNPCPLPGACCIPSTPPGQCVLVVSGTCGNAAWYQGDGSVCSPNPCTPAPTNDICLSAITVTLGQPAAFGDNSLAVSSPDETAPACGVQRGVWFDFTAAPDGGVYQFDTQGSAQLDTKIGAYTTCGGTLLGCDDDSGISPPASSLMRLTLGASQNIKVLLGTFSTAQAGGFVLNIGRVTSGACCDNSTGSCSIAPSSSCVFTYQGDGSVCGAIPCGTGACCNTSTGTCTVVPNGTCGFIGGFRGIGTTCLPNPCPQAPSNDTCLSAITVTLGQPAAFGDNSLAVSDPEETAPPCGVQRGVWFDFTADPDGGAYQFDTQGSAQLDTKIGAYTTCGGALLGCNDDSGISPPNSSLMTLTLTPGQNIKVLLGTFGTVTPGGFVLNVARVASGACCNTSTGTCTLVPNGTCGFVGGYRGDGTSCSSNPCPQPPSNDICPSAITVTLGQPAAFGDNSLAVSNPDETATACGVQRGVWFDFTAAPDGGVYQFDTQGSAQLDTKIGAYTTCGGTLLGCNDDSGISPPNSSLMTLTLTPGQNIKVLLGTFSTAQAGGFVLNISRIDRGACCCGSNCSITTVAACTGTGRVYSGDGSACAPISATVPCCRGDYNRSGAPATVQDIFDFLAGYFANSPCADSNDSGTNSVQDIFDFLAAYFAAGCS